MWNVSRSNSSISLCGKSTDITWNDKAFFVLIYSFMIYQSSKFPFSRVSLIKSVLCESDEIRLSPSHQRKRETMRFSPVNNEKNRVRHPVKTQPVHEIDIAVFQIKFNITNFRNNIRCIFVCSSLKVCNFFDSWYIIKIGSLRVHVSTLYDQSKNLNMFH